MCDMHQIANENVRGGFSPFNFPGGGEEGCKEPVYAVPLLWETKLHTRTDQRT